MTRPDVQERRKRERSVKAMHNVHVQAMLTEAAQLERQAASLAHTLATLDEERARLLIRATVLRVEAAR